MITAQLATIPGREQSARRTIASLINQVDSLTVTYNHPDLEITDAFADAVREFNQEKLRIRLADNSLGDAEKFVDVEKLTGYVLTCDDDLIYPVNYVQEMIRHVDTFNGIAIITLHGRNLLPGKISSYYAPSNRIEAFHCLKDVEGYHLVQSGGTGVMAWNADKVRIENGWFMEPNMADVWVAVNARRIEVPIFVAPHRWDWLQYQEQPEGSTIWEQHFENDKIQTAVWNGDYHK